MQRITKTEVKRVSEAGIYRADDTLYLRVRPSGRKHWIQRIVIEGRRTDLGLGSVEFVSLDEARRIALDNRAKIRNGDNPITDNRKVLMPTFGIAATKTHASLKPTWKNKQHSVSWMQVVQKHAFPVLENLPVDTITQRHVLDVLEPIWNKQPETARRVRQRIRAVLRWCQSKEYVTHNVADERIDGALPAMPKVKEHHKALPYRDVPEAVRVISSRVSSARLCLRFLILTAVRSNEAREATWDEIDRETRTWNIPAERMKGGKPHRVPLSESALVVLDDAEHLRDGSDLIFPSVTKSRHPMTPDNLMKVWRKTGVAKDTTVHGFRTSFRTWAAEQTDIPREVLELALAHNLGSAVEQAYSRSDLLEKRVRLMDHWAEFLG